MFCGLQDQEILRYINAHTKETIIQVVSSALPISCPPLCSNLNPENSIHMSYNSTLSALAQELIPQIPAAYVLFSLRHINELTFTLPVSL